MTADRRSIGTDIGADGFAPMSPTKAIRAHCLDCCNGSLDEVRKCMALRCPSWPFRMGSSPWRAGKTEAQLEAIRRVANARRLGASGAAEGQAGTRGLPDDG